MSSKQFPTAGARFSGGMGFSRRLAWAQLVREKRRFGAAVAGIAFAVVLMLMQLGFRDALYSSATLIHARLRGDLVMISSQYEFLGAFKNFTRRRLYQCMGFKEVKSVEPVYLGLGNWKNPVDGRETSIFVMGMEPQSQVLDLPELADESGVLQRPDSVLFDAASRREFGPVAETFRQGKPVVTEVQQRRVRVGGLFQLGASFAADGNLITSDLNFLRLFPDRRQGLINLGLIQLEAGAQPARIRDEMAADLPGDVRVLTRPQFVELERHYWSANSPIGFIFALGTFMGLIVGFVIVYQILYTDVVDHLAEYATLKAIGRTDTQLFSVVAWQSFILSLLGFAPGWFISWALYLLTRHFTMLPISMTPGRTVTVLGLAFLLCAASGGLAMRKLKTADPADIF